MKKKLMAKILITGGSGLIGTRLSKMLLQQGHQPAWLSRNAKPAGPVQMFEWNIEKKQVDKKAFEDTEVVIHLAGAGIADKRWTKRYKQEIINSRVKSAAVICETLLSGEYPVKKVIGASAVGYYGAVPTKREFTETDAPGHDFLSQVCIKWENSYQPLVNAGIPVVVLRTAVVLAKNGGAYNKMRPVFALGLGAPVAPGRQAFPWIHIDDLCRLYIKASLDNNMRGVFNAVAPQQLTNREFSAALAKSLGKPFFMPAVPALFLRLALGELSSTLTTGVSISSGKVLETGFEFQYRTIDAALSALATQ
jgi:uncharacterized protein (TIGR01777 family)